MVVNETMSMRHISPPKKERKKWSIPLNFCTYLINDRADYKFHPRIQFNIWYLITVWSCFMTTCENISMMLMNQMLRQNQNWMLCYAVQYMTIKFSQLSIKNVTLHTISLSLSLCVCVCVCAVHVHLHVHTWSAFN